MRPSEEAKSKVMKAYAQSGQYHIIVESRVQLTVSSPIPISLGCLFPRFIFVRVGNCSCFSPKKTKCEYCREMYIHWSHTKIFIQIKFLTLTGVLSMMTMYVPI